ncbi:MAG: competence protein ComK [Tepidanaerobacteraceae bacterium]|jgi:hypothetical protein|nr:hypothetical protein [Thermoanaerobacterales bacterium]
MNVEEILETGLAAMVPVYEEGNVTKVFARDGTVFLIRKTCKTVLKNLARFYGVDLAATRNYYGSCINKKQGVPIPMAANLLLIPVKARKNPLGENDGTLGYVNFQEIKEVTDSQEGRCCITFQCEKNLLTLVSRKTMREYIKNAQLVKSLYLNRHFQKYEEPSSQITALHDSGNKYKAEENLLREYLLELLLEVIRKNKNSGH